MDVKNLSIRTLSGAVLVTLVVASILINWITAWCVFLLLAALTAFEYVSLNNKRGLELNLVIAPLLVVLLFVQMMLEEFFGGRIWFWVRSGMVVCYVLLFLGWIVFEPFTKNPNHQLRRHVIMMSQLYVVLPFIALYQLCLLNKWLALLPFILIWVNDTFAYLGGSLIGKHKLAPSVSPGKSWEGFVCGNIFALLAGYIVSLFPEFGGFSWWIYLVVAQIVVVSGTLGDLMESSLKREIGVKDSGNIIPGHGGMLDRFDSILFAAPAMAFFLLFFI